MSDPKCEMVINYVPGEECRVAVIEEGKLEEFHAERADAVSHVGNIYVGKVKNVEPAIQAAFVDFGLEQNGFLHVSDLHPQYFPGEDNDTTERVGKKTPRRDRPPIQECLRRGQEIAVQVLKEGVGTKGPTVTSYLSIPGRFLVMMPKMDRVGVSRKVEDEETRRQMREILDQLELPEGFGFIVRTAGMERTKAELKRDLAYLQRLWKDMEKRWNKGGSKPRLLYSESDLLMRALRDMLTPDIERIVIDDESAMARAARFLKIVAPRTTTKLVRYTARTPIFHSMGIENQIRNMYSREVPLPSGGRLVIDETEALVAIDVNSGKMRDARDAETNAYRTNMEAADEICRQLRLRDVGGIIINDLIDMRHLKHRREVEAKFKELLKKDRARTTLEQISAFGILEMTRQRMRGSYESVHFTDCPTCRGRGLVQRPDSVAADAMRELAALLEHERVARIEMAVSPRIAGELLSSKRRALNRLERLSGKHVDVRVSESVPVDRVTFYCYDDRGADIDTTRLAIARAKHDELVPFVDTAKGDDWAVDPDEEVKTATAIEPAEPEPVAEPVADPFLDALERDDAGDSEASRGGEGESEEGGGRRRRRRRRGGRGRGGDEISGGRPEGQGHQQRRPETPARDAAPPEEASPGDGNLPDDQQGMNAGENGEGGRRRRRRRRRGRGRGGEEGRTGGPGPQGQPEGGAGTPIFEGGQDEGGDEDQPVAVAAPQEPSSWDLEVTEAGSMSAGSPEPMSAGESHGDEAERAPIDEPQGQTDDMRDDDRRDDSGGPGAPGEGERRGRRRRRRRGRGRGGPGGEGAPMGSNAPAEGPGSEPAGASFESEDAGPATESSDRWDEGGSEGSAEMNEPDAEFGPDEGQGAGDEGGMGRPESSANGPGGPNEGQGGGRRRRRRRRRGGGGGGAPNGDGGRGNNGGNGGQSQGGPQGGGHRQNQGHGQGGQGQRGQGGHGGRGDRGDRGNRRPDSNQQRRDDRGGGGRDNRPPPNDNTRPMAPRPSAPPPPSSGPASGPAQGSSSGGGSPPPKGPRTLYSSRRKLLPSERSKIKPE